MAREQEAGLRRVALDGNHKLCGRTCGRPAAAIVENAELGVWSVTCCDQEPARKRRRCAEHLTETPAPDHLGSAVVTGHRAVRRLAAPVRRRGKE